MATPELTNQAISYAARLLEDAAAHMSQAYRNKKLSSTLKEVKAAMPLVAEAKVWLAKIDRDLEQNIHDYEAREVNNGTRNGGNA